MAMLRSVVISVVFLTVLADIDSDWKLPSTHLGNGGLFYLQKTDKHNDTNIETIEMVLSNYLHALRRVDDFQHHVCPRCRRHFSLLNKIKYVFGFKNFGFSAIHNSFPPVLGSTLLPFYAAITLSQPSADCSSASPVSVTHDVLQFSSLLLDGSPVLRGARWFSSSPVLRNARRHDGPPASLNSLAPTPLSQALKKWIMVHFTLLRDMIGLLFNNYSRVSIC
ncbi:PREDICTED: uncharacterized protein LOC109190628 [Ipomoea nil]|uniref:uncharacterized protein LOC109190628 n=1 Tax=Ipomoea nil TaxID=35883 RepID=UPI000901562C|nr:PREDICTED: uncharacterized protein LOC109190628 [Ipomoea nil]